LSSLIETEAWICLGQWGHNLSQSGNVSNALMTKSSKNHTAFQMLQPESCLTLAHLQALLYAGILSDATRLEKALDIDILQKR